VTLLWRYVHGSGDDEPLVAYAGSAAGPSGSQSEDRRQVEEVELRPGLGDGTEGATLDGA
jgi:hypothetical protein